jgi:hypothetical protein
MIRKDPWTAMLSPLVALVPAGVAVDYFVDLVFIRRWGTAVNGPRFRPAPKPIFGGAAGARETIGVGLS